MSKIYKIWIMLLGMTIFFACNPFEVEDVQELNSPELDAGLVNPTAVQIDLLGVGLQAAMRNYVVTLRRDAGAVGREVVYYASTESRYHTELLGATAAIDPAGLMLVWYGSTNQTRRRAELFLLAAERSSALSAAQKSAVTGFCKTVQAYQILYCLNMLHENGIRTTFADLFVPGDLLKPGKFSNYNEGLAYVKTLVDDGQAALGRAGTTPFPFTVTAGWAGFNTPANFIKFNRAVAARVAMYQKNWAGVLSSLEGSYINDAANTRAQLDAGPFYTYSTTPNDATNGLFQPLNGTGAVYAAQRDFVTQAEAGDARVFGTSMREGGTAKVRQRANPFSLGTNPTSSHEVQMYASNVASVPIIRNEELILMRAEALIQTDKLADAVVLLDRIRTTHKLMDLATAKPTVVANKDLLIDELLNQRRYSLFMEGGHRYFDMRRYNRLSQLPLDLPNHKVWPAFPRPQAEADWDLFNP